MATDTTSLEDILKLQAWLAALPGSAVLPTPHARVHSGNVSPSTWERLRATGQQPPAIKITDRLLGYRKSALDKRLKALTEKRRDDTASHYIAPGKPAAPKAGVGAPEPARQRAAKAKPKTRTAKTEGLPTAA